MDLGERGVYDTRNVLNDLTGREWTYFLNSVWVTAYPPVADQCGFDLRKIHPCPKPPYLMRDLVRFFTKPDGWVFDPFAGVGGTLLGASLCRPHRNAVGIELNPEFATAYERVVEEEGLHEQKMYRGDAAHMLRFPGVRNRAFDLILTDPPYTNLMGKRKNGQKQKLYGRSDPSPFSDSDRDLGNLEYTDFLHELRRILEKATTHLKSRGYLVVFCGDVQPTAEHDGLLHADMIRALTAIPGLVYRGMRIWHDQAVDLYPFGYPYAFVMNQLHQYILVFRKQTS